MTIKTKWFSSSMAGAPVLSGSAGAMLSVLDGCLVNGFNLQTLTSLVVAGNVATATKAGHGFVVSQVVVHAGASPAGLNGDARITEVTTDTYKFATSGISDQTATGTITVKAAPAAWEKQWSGTNLGVYRSTDGLSTRGCIRVDDTVGQYSTVRCAEQFTDVNTEVNGVVTHYFKKSNATDATARPWLVIADDKTAYLGVQWTNAGIYDFYHFGDFDSIIAGDVGNFKMQGLTNSAPGTIGQYSTLSDSYNSAPNTGGAMRGQSQLPGLVSLAQGSVLCSTGMLYASTGAGTIYNFTWCLSGNHGYSGNANQETFASPSIGDNGYHFFPVYLFESTVGGKMLRGTMRGLLHVLEYLPVSTGYSVLNGVENVPGGLVLMARSAGHVQSGTGPAYIYPASTVAFLLGDF